MTSSSLLRRSCLLCTAFFLALSAGLTWRSNRTIALYLAAIAVGVVVIPFVPE